MLNSIYHMTLKLIKNSNFWRENDVKFLPFLRKVIINVTTLRY